MMCTAFTRTLAHNSASIQHSLQLFVGILSLPSKQVLCGDSRQQVPDDPGTFAKVRHLIHTPSTSK